MPHVPKFRRTVNFFLFIFNNLSSSPLVRDLLFIETGEPIGMKVICQKCKHEFDVPTASVGKVEFSQCRNLFRVTYKLRIPCENCKSLLQLSPGEPDQAIGTPIPFDFDEVTEQSLVSEIDPLEKTLPRTELPKTNADPLPTVRLSRTVKKQIEPQSRAFRIIEGTIRRPSPVHVALRQNKKVELPYLKILIAGVIFLGATTTLALTLLAMRQKPRPTPASLNSSPAHVEKAAVQKDVPLSEKYSVKEGAVGGPYEPVEAKTASVHTPTFYVPHIDDLSSKFGVRKDPIFGHEAFHGGIDLAVHSRAEIPAASDGEIVYSGWKGGYGNTVIIRHKNGYETIYGHMTQRLVLKGAHVRQGDPIGLVGSTGRSTGNHIHFEVRKDGQRVDPLRLDLSKTLPKKTG